MVCGRLFYTQAAKAVICAGDPNSKAAERKRYWYGKKGKKGKKESWI